MGTFLFSLIQWLLQEGAAESPPAAASDHPWIKNLGRGKLGAAAFHPTVLFGQDEDIPKLVSHRISSLCVHTSYSRAEQLPGVTGNIWDEQPWLHFLTENTG